MRRVGRNIVHSLMLCFLCVVMICTAFVAITSESKASYKEDLNGDSKITEDDSKELRQALVNGLKDEIYDVNGDGDVDVRDIICVKKGVVKFVDAEKFVAKEVSEIGNASQITLGSLFEQKGEYTVDSSSIKVDIDVADSNVTYEYVQNEEDWTKSSLEFDGVGNVTVTVYDYCQPTSITLKIVNADKFELKVDSPYTIKNTDKVILGDVFTQLPNVDVDSDKVSVKIAENKEEDNVTWNITEDKNNWENTEIKFEGDGTVTVTIEEDSNPTALTITVEAVYTDKFVAKFPNTDKYLYRVGNQNTVALGSLFEAIEGAEIGNVTATVEAVDENNSVSGTFTSNTDWTKGTIQFNGVGVVKVTIQDSLYCNPTELIVEVVDATNLTSAKGTTSGGNFVLLSNVNTADYVYYWNCTLYGNGFTYSLKGAPTSYSSSHGHGVLMTQNATLDNLVIEGDVYDEYGAYTTNNDYNAAIDVMGDTIIQNCYISGCSAPISTRANATITNTTLYGGAVGNLIIKGGTVTLENVTTANYDDGRDLIGMGIVVHSDASEDAKLVLNGDIKQYNFISESKTPSNSYAKNLHTVMFSDSCSQYHFGTSPSRYVNTGIISLTTNFDIDDITDKANTGYVGQTVSTSGFNGYVYTQPNTSGTVNNAYNKESDSHVAATQGAVPPSYSFDYTTKNYVAKTEGSNDYCYLENGIVKISMDDGDTFNWDTSILTATKGNQTLNYTVSMNGIDYTGKSIAFNTAGNYEVEYTYTDQNNYGLDEEGNITTYSKTYTKTVSISVAVIKATTKHAEFTFGSSNQATEKITVGEKTYISATGVSHDNSTWSYITVNGTKVYYPIVEATIVDKKIAYFNVFKNVVTITDYADNGTGSAVTYNSSTTSMPSGLTVVKGTYKTFTDISSNWSTLNDTALTYTGASNVFKYAASASASSTPTIYSNALVFASPEVTNARDEYITMVQYSYTDATNTTYYYYVGYHMAAKGDGNCVTPDTLITLADGSKVRVDSLTGKEELLVWNMETGKLDSAPIMFVDSEQEMEVEVIKLYFSDGTEVKAISEHGFWDYDLNKYVYLDREAEQYIGHEFAKQNGDQLERVTLVDVVLENEVTSAWSPVTVGHLCYFVNDMLSMPGGVGGLFNIFEVDAETMTYDYEALARDIELYGLFTYEEVNAIAPLTEEMFYAAGGQYLKISIAKGNMTVEELREMILRYSKFI